MPNLEAVDTWLGPPTVEEVAQSRERKRTAIDLARELGARTYDQILFSLEEMVQVGDLTESEFLDLLNEME